MKIQVNGQEVEAYHLIMKKENALEILNGTKKVEIREFNQKYGTLFIDPQKEAEYFEKMKQPNFEYIDENGVAECDKIYKDVKYIYFTNYNKSWSLVVEIDQIYMLYMIKDDIEFLSEQLGFKEYDNEWQQFEGKDLDDIPSFFAIDIKRIVSNENL